MLLSFLQKQEHGFQKLSEKKDATVYGYATIISKGKAWQANSLDLIKLLLTIKNMKV